MYRDTIFQYVKKQYGTIPEYLWNDLPDSAKSMLKKLSP